VSPRLLAWAIYDFANTLVFAVVMTRYFLPQIRELTGSRTHFWVGFVGASLAASILSPIVGVAAETSGRLRRDFAIAVLACAGGVAGMGLTESPIPLTALYAATFVAYQTSLVFYNAMLVDVAPPGRIGWASGLGAALGYVGGPIGIAAAGLLHNRAGMSLPVIYLGTAGAFLLGSLPALLWVRPVRVRRGRVRPLAELARAWGRIREAMGRPVERGFYVGNFFCSDALNTVLVCASDFALEGLRFTKGETDLLLVAANVLAFPAGLLLGVAADRRGAGFTYRIAAAALLGAVLLPLLPLPTPARMAALAAPGALGMCGIALAGRKWLLEILAGRPAEGPFGIFGLTNKFSIFGVILYSVVADVAGSPRIAVLVPAAAVLAGLAVLRGVPTAKS
jgi:UMF1 family MFS transporter